MAQISNITNISDYQGKKAVLDGIQFDCIDNYGMDLSIILTRKNNVWNGGSELKYIVNAVDINWNGGILEGADLQNGTDITINSTGDLLKLIKDMQSEIYVLSAAVVALATS